ncbi:MAG: peroxidase family protein [Pseudomonadota bacterium]
MFKGYFGSSKPGWFEYLFSCKPDPSHWKIPESELKKLVSYMTLPTRPGIGVGGIIPAGYTYLGQLITHDIVKKTTGEQSRRVSPWLNLDSIYPDHNDAKALDGYIDEDGKFILNVGACDSSWDFNREDGVAQTVEPRNDENIILAQIVVTWMRFHNRAVQYLIDSKQRAGKDSDRLENYLGAKHFGIMVFQTLVVKDYLRLILQDSVYDHYFDHLDGGEGELDQKLFFNHFTQCEDEVPVEFSHAAFRFGHSIVRLDYRMNGCPLSRRILLNVLNKDAEIPEDLKMKWELFFYEYGKECEFQEAFPIDIFVSSGFSHFMKEEVESLGKTKDLLGLRALDEICPSSFSDCVANGDQESQEKVDARINFVVIDLKASTKVLTPSDILKAIADRKDYKKILSVMSLPEDFDVASLEYEVTTINGSINKKFCGENLVMGQDSKLEQFNLSNLPLWLYTLMEGQDLPLASAGDQGSKSSSIKYKLGPLSSLITADTLFASIQYSDISIFKTNSKEEIPIELKETFNKITDLANTPFSFFIIDSFPFDCT